MPDLVVYGASSSQALLEVIRQPTNGLHILEVDGHISRSELPSAATLYSLKSFLSYEDLRYLDDLVLSIAEQWYRPQGVDYLEWRGASLGTVMTGHVIWLLVSVLKNITCASRAILQTGATQVFLGAGVGIDVRAWELVATNLGVSPKVVDQDSGGSVLQECGREQRPTVSPLAIRILRAIEHEITRLLSRDYVGSKTDSRPRALIAPHSPRFSWMVATLRQSRRVSWLDERSWRPPLIERVLAKLERWNARHHFERCWGQLSKQLEESHLFWIEGQSFWPVVEKGIQTLYLDVGSRIAEEKFLAQRVLVRTRPALVLAPEAWDGGQRGWCLAAQQMAKPVVSTQHDKVSKGYLDRFKIAAGDYVLTWGPSAIPWMVLQGFSSEQIIPAGWPPLTSLRHAPGLDEAARQEITEQLSIQRGCPVVVFFGQYWVPWTACVSPLDYADLWLLIADAASILHDMTFVAKVHPNACRFEGLAATQRCVSSLECRNLPNVRISPSDLSATDLIGIASVVVTYHSTTAIEAMLQDKPVILINVSDKPPIMSRPIHVGAALSASTAGELSALLRHILSDPQLQTRMQIARRRYLDEVLDGCSSEESYCARLDQLVWSIIGQ
jgi:hypothetical protein